MIASRAVPALLPAHISVPQTSRFTTQAGLCRHPAVTGQGRYTAAACGRPPDLTEVTCKRPMSG